MAGTLGGATTDAIVLSIVGKEEAGTYGYKITQDVRSVIDVSESTLYPVLRRLQKDGFLETYDKEYGGRNRRYYILTALGRICLDEHLKSWKEYKDKMDNVFFGGKLNE